MMKYLEIIVYIIIICAYFILYLNDDSFLNEGKTRHWSGYIQSYDGELDILDSLSESFGISGNPLYNY